MSPWRVRDPDLPFGGNDLAPDCPRPDDRIEIRCYFGAVLVRAFANAMIYASCPAHPYSRPAPSWSLPASSPRLATSIGTAHHRCR